MAKLGSLILMGSVLLIIIISGIVADKYQYPLPSKNSKYNISIQSVIREQFKSNNSLNLEGTSKMDINNNDFTDADQSSKLDKINEQIKQNHVKLIELQNEKNKMSNSLEELNIGISNLQKQRDSFIKAQIEIKKMLFT